MNTKAMASKIVGEEGVSAAEAKANFKAKCVEVGGKLVWTFGNGSIAEIDPKDLSEEVKAQALLHGLKQTISDSYSGIKTASESHAFAQVRIDTLLGGEWSSRGKAGEGNNDLAQAVCEVAGKSMSEVLAVLAGLDDTQRKALAKKPQVAAAVAKIKADRLAKVVGADDSSLDSLFGGL